MAMQSDDVKKTPIKLDARERDRLVLFTSETEDRFLMSCREAVRAANIGASAVVIVDEIREFVNEVGEWVVAEGTRIAECYIAPREGQLVVFVVPKSHKYDFDLSDALTDLDLRITQKYRIPCEVMQIPEDDLESVVDLDSPASLDVRRALQAETPSQKVDA